MRADCSSSDFIGNQSFALALVRFVDLVAHAVLAREDALNNSDDGMMFVGALRCGNSIFVGGGDIGEYVAGVLFAEDSGIR